MKIFNKFIYLLAAVLIYIFSTTAFAVTRQVEGTAGGYDFMEYTMSPGFFENHVLTVYVDRMGWVYAGTDDGLWIGRKGAYSFTHYNPSYSLVNSIYVDAKSTIYMATPFGLWIGTQKAMWGYNFENSGLTNESVDTVFVDAEGLIYIGTSNGLSIGTKDNKGYHVISHYDGKQGLGSNAVLSIYVDKKGVIYAGTEHGLSIGIKDNDNKDYHFTNYDRNSGVGDKRMNYDSQVKSVSIFNDVVYAGTETGVSIGTKDENGYHFTHYDNQYPDNRDLSKGENFQSYTFSVFAANDAVYVGTAGGVLKGTKDDTGYYHFTSIDGLHFSSSYVYSVYVDANGVLYAGATQGLHIGTKSAAK